MHLKSIVPGVIVINNVIVGNADHFEQHLKDAILRASSIRMIVSFVMESGVKTILSYLLDAASRQVPIQLLTGRYLGITEPSALYLLHSQLGDNVAIHFYDEPIRSFHPKAYIFDYYEDSEVFIGSSNLSRSALTSGIEWNYRFLKSQHPQDYTLVSEHFDQMFHDHAVAAVGKELKHYADNLKKPAISRNRVKSFPAPSPATPPEPRGAQLEALYYLAQARMEGVQKGVVAAATGVGKTHLAA